MKIPLDSIVRAIFQQFMTVGIPTPLKFIILAEVIEELETTLFGDADDDEDTSPAAIEARFREQYQLYRRKKRSAKNNHEDDTPRSRRRREFQWDRARECIAKDYLGPTPLFRDRDFERIFRIHRAGYEEIFQVLLNESNYFRETIDAVGHQGIDPNVKALCAIKQIAYGVSPAAFQDYFQISESTGRRCFLHFCSTISGSDMLRSKYLRDFNRSDARKASDLHQAAHGVQGMIGSLDCMHLNWKNCPVAWQGHYSGKEKKATIVLEALVDYNLWFWHAEFGAAGSLNDINIWDRSSLLTKFLDGSFARDVDFEYTINGELFTKLFVLVDGIYPPLARFVKGYAEATDDFRRTITKWQESSRKDVERGFGVLQRKFHVLVKKVELWYLNDIKNVVEVCIILHNMMVSHRIEMDEEESADWYAVEEDNGEPANEDFLDSEAQAVLQRVQVQNEHAAMFNTVGEHVGNRGGLFNEIAQLHRRQESLPLRQAFVQERWNVLHDITEHDRLQNAIGNELSTNH